MIDKKSGGARANRSGERLEDFVAERLDEIGYQKVAPSHFQSSRKEKQPIFSRQYEVEKGIYQKNRHVDIIIYHPHAYPDCLVIQCKWQSSQGSVEEKYPYEVLNIQQGAYDTIIILDGDGYSSGAKQWLLDQKGKNKLKDVMNQGEFSRFANRKLQSR